MYTTIHLDGNLEFGPSFELLLKNTSAIFLHMSFDENKYLWPFSLYLEVEFLDHRVGMLFSFLDAAKQFSKMVVQI